MPTAFTQAARPRDEAFRAQRLAADLFRQMPSDAPESEALRQKAIEAWNRHVMLGDGAKRAA